MATKYVCVDIHTVNPRDTLYTIAQKYGMSVDLLMRVNGIRNPYNLQVGARICIPGVMIPDEPPGEEAPAPRPQPRPCKRMHTVKRGDTLYMIAKMHRVSLDALMNANPNMDPYRLKTGMEICIPE